MLTKALPADFALDFTDLGGIDCERCWPIKYSSVDPACENRELGAQQSVEWASEFFSHSGFPGLFGVLNSHRLLVPLHLTEFTQAKSTFEKQPVQIQQTPDPFGA